MAAKPLFGWAPTKLTASSAVLYRPRLSSLPLRLVRACQLSPWKRTPLQTAELMEQAVPP